MCTRTDFVNRVVTEYYMICNSATFVTSRFEFGIFLCVGGEGVGILLGEVHSKCYSNVLNAWLPKCAQNNPTPELWPPTWLVKVLNLALCAICFSTRAGMISGLYNGHFLSESDNTLLLLGSELLQHCQRHSWPRRFWRNQLFGKSRNFSSRLDTYTSHENSSRHNDL